MFNTRFDAPAQIHRLGLTVAVTLMVSSIATISLFAQKSRDVPLNVATDGDALYYTPSLAVSHGDGLVSAVLRNDINVFMNLGSPNGRTESPVDLCVGLNAPTVGVPRGIYCGDLGANTSGPEDMRHMTTGQTISKRFQVTWTDSTGSYWLRFGDDLGSAPIAVTCDGLDSSGCSSWTLLGAGGPARLTFRSTSKQAVTQVLGDYQVPFVWTVSLK